MEHDTYGPESGDDLLFVMGWGNRLDGTNERWFTDRLTHAGWRVHAFQIPTNIRDFEREYLTPVREQYRRLDDPVCLSHSTGGLVVAHLEPEHAVYLSPWWAFHGEKLRESMLEWGAKLPVPVPVFPIDFEREEVGELVTDVQWEQLPKRVSLTFVREIRRAQADLPAIPETAQVVCSLRDTVVGLQGIGEHVTPGQVTLYDGGHEPFASRDREEITETILEELDAV